MILVFVEHFLNEEGVAIFPQWITNIRAVLQAYDGFISIKQIKDIENENRCVLELHFTNLKLLREWAKSTEHDQFIAQLKEYRLKKQRSQIFEYV
ncbi:MAG: hypothetical protein MI974_18895 [Chitinophagales bacterium]|nr:hypothetical protein [Chitinophagales bacterium]